MRERVMLTLLLLALAACANMQESATRAGRNINEGALSLRQKMIDYTEPARRKKPQEPRPAQSAYCYKTQADVLCYRDPLPGQEGRLIGYQEPFEGAPRERVEATQGAAGQLYAPVIDNVAPLAPISSVPLGAPVGMQPASSLPEKTPFAVVPSAPVSVKPADGGGAFTAAPLPKSAAKKTLSSEGPQELLPVKQR